MSDFESVARWLDGDPRAEDEARRCWQGLLDGGVWQDCYAMALALYVGGYLMTVDLRAEIRRLSGSQDRCLRRQLIGALRSQERDVRKFVGEFGVRAARNGRMILPPRLVKG